VIATHADMPRAWRVLCQPLSNDAHATYSYALHRIRSGWVSDTPQTRKPQHPQGAQHVSPAASVYVPVLSVAWFAALSRASLPVRERLAV
jgi:hypothetical protein